MVKTASQPSSVMGWMESLADATRLRLLRLLERHELGVAELCDILQLPQSTVSRHLKVLSDQHWVRSRRQGATHLYRFVLDEIDAAPRKIWLVAREQTDAWATIHQDQLRLDRRLQERESDAESFFAGAAGEWDRIRGELYGHDFTAAAMLALLPSDTIVADLGCGSGQVTTQLAAYVKKVIAVDNSAAMLRAAKKRVASLKNVDLRRGDLASLPIDANTCDAAMMLLTLTYLSDPQLALREAARILKPTGKLIVVDLLPHDRDDFRRQMGQQRRGFAAKEIEHLMIDAGLKPIATRPLPPGENVKGPALFLASAEKE